MRRLLTLAFLLASLAGCARYPTVYGPVTKPSPELIEFGEGKAGCWNLSTVEPWQGYGDLLLPQCEALAHKHQARLFIHVATEEWMDTRKCHVGMCDAKEIRGYVEWDSRLFGNLFVINETVFELGIWQELWDHEVRHLMGERHDHGEDFDD